MWRIMSSGKHALDRSLVVRAAGGVNVVIARIPAELRQFDPSFQAKCERLRLACGNFDVLSFDQIFRAAGEFDSIIARRKFYLFAVRAVDLRMKVEIGRKPLGL